MSDTEDGDGFDKEAEKEKLRAQLEREEAERRSTQHMSELLLKGATMTNKHCDACGDPLFRYEGREFCPSCAQAGDAEPADADGAERAPQAPESGAAGASEPPSGGEIEDSGGAPVDAERTAAGAETSQPGGVTPPEPAGAAEVGSDVSEARAALVRTLSSVARRAEATDDVARSRELLAAAREAAEAIAAIDRVGR